MIVTFCMILIATFTVSSGVKWNDFRGGKSPLPIKQELAKASGWVVCETDDHLKIQWYSNGVDDALTVAYDQLDNAAGVRLTVYEKDIDPDYLSLYKESTGIFEAVEYKGKNAYKSTILFTPEGYLQKGGRQLKWMGTDEVAYFAYLKVAGKYKMLARETCMQADFYSNQGCHSKYGLVLSHFGSKSKCNSLKPFYTVFDLEGDGDLIGFGWLLFNKVTLKDSFLKVISADSAKAMFPHSPSCLTSCQSLALAEVWLTYADAQKTSCPSGSWVDKNCKKRRKVEDESSSDASDVSDIKEESFWSKWFG